MGLGPVLDGAVPFFLFEAALQYRTSHGHQHLDTEVPPPNPQVLAGARGWVLRQHHANSKAHKGSSGERGPNNDRNIRNSAAENEANNRKPKNDAQIDPVIEILFQQALDLPHTISPKHRHHPSNGNSHTKSLSELESEKP